MKANKKFKFDYNDDAHGPSKFQVKHLVNYYIQPDSLSRKEFC